MSSQAVWFKLVEASGQPFKGASASKAFVDPSADVNDFRKAVKAECDEPGYLKDFPSSTLQVYRNKVLQITIFIGRRETTFLCSELYPRLQKHLFW